MKNSAFRKFLYEICEDCDCHNSNNPYCTLIEFISDSNHSTPRFLMQLKCVEKFKYELHRDMTWDDALSIWVNNGYAKIFSDKYNEDIKFKELYKSIMNKTS